MQYCHSVSFVILCRLKCFGLNMGFWHGRQGKGFILQDSSCVKEKAHSDFKTLLLFTGENLVCFNTGIFW